METVSKYFPKLSKNESDKFIHLEELHRFWATKINLISKNDLPHLFERHILHSLSIAKFISFKPKTTILDIGTGGGFPGVPLAILFPEVQFYLVDSIGKKIETVKHISKELNLENIITINNRAEKIKIKYDFVVSRAVSKVDNIIRWTKYNFKNESFNKLKNGYLFLKGGDINSEIKILKKNKIVYLSDYFGEEFFKTKKLIYSPFKLTPR